MRQKRERAVISRNDLFRCRNPRFRCRNRSFRCRNRSFRCRNRSFRCRNRSFRCRNKSFRCRNRSFRCRNRSFRCRNRSFRCRNRSFRYRNKSFRCRNRSFRYRKQWFRCRNARFRYRNRRLAHFSRFVRPLAAPLPFFGRAFPSSAFSPRASCGGRRWRSRMRGAQVRGTINCSSSELPETAAHAWMSCWLGRPLIRLRHLLPHKKRGGEGARWERDQSNENEKCGLSKRYGCLHPREFMPGSSFLLRSPMFIRTLRASPRNPRFLSSSTSSVRGVRDDFADRRVCPDTAPLLTERCERQESL